MPGAEIKSKPSLEDADDNADLSKVEVEHDPAGEEPLKTDDDVKDVKMEEAIKPSKNGTTKEEAPHGLPHETVPQPNLDAVK